MVGPPAEVPYRQSQRACLAASAAPDHSGEATRRAGGRRSRRDRPGPAPGPHRTVVGIALRRGPARFRGDCPGAAAGQPAVAWARAEERLIGHRGRELPGGRGQASAPPRRPHGGRRAGRPLPAFGAGPSGRRYRTLQAASADRTGGSPGPAQAPGVRAARHQRQQAGPPQGHGHPYPGGIAWFPASSLDCRWPSPGRGETVVDSRGWPPTPA